MALPQWKLNVIPAEEQSFTRDLDLLFLVLFHYRLQFQSALFLFDAASEIQNGNPQYADLIGQWKFIAARDSAMSIYHFGKAIEAIRGSMKQYPLTRKMVDHLSIRKASKDFESHFPTYVAMRHAIAHHAENMSVSEKGKHTIDGQSPFGYGKGAMFQHMLVDRDYGFSFNGQYVQSNISEETFQKLSETYDQVRSAFSSLIEKWTC